MNDIVYRGESNQPLTNSLLVAQTFGKSHKHVLDAIREIVKGYAEKSADPMFEETTYINEQNKQSYPMFIMNQDGFTLLAMGFNGKKAMEFKLKYIEAFNKMRKEIEKSRENFQIPHSFSEALMLAANQAKQIEMQQAQIVTISKANAELGGKVTEMKPKADYYDNLVASTGTCTITQIAIDYGMSAIKMNKLLFDLRVQRKVHDQWIPYGKYLDCGYVESKPIPITRSDGTPDTKYNTEWTTKGRVFIYNLLKSKGILPVKEEKINSQRAAKQEPTQQTINFNE